MAEDAEHAPHVAERGAGGARDVGEPLARGVMVAGPQLAAERRRVAHDRPEALGDRHLEVGGDPRALLLRRMARVAGTVARPAGGLVGELSLQEPLAARPAPDQHGGGDRREGQQRLARRLRRGVEGDARGGDGRRGDGRARQPQGSGRVAARAVERDHDGGDRRHHGAGEESAQRRLDRQRERQHRRHRQRRPPAPRQRHRQQRQRQRADQPLAARGGGEQHLELAGHGERRRNRSQKGHARGHTAKVTPGPGPVVVPADEPALLLWVEMRA